MNYPTREEFEDLKEEVRKLKEQQTEPIRIARLEIDQGGIQEQLIQVNKRLESVIQTQTDQSERLDTLQQSCNETKIQMDGARADIVSLRASQSDFGEYLTEDRQVQAMHTDKLDRHTESLGQLIDFVQSHDAMLKDHGELLKTMATKDDLAALETRVETRLDTMETRLGTMETRMETRLGTMETRMETRLDAMETRIVGLIRQFLDKKAGE
jgi:chromosome segregation ATPase